MIRKIEPKILCPTHFGSYEDVEAHWSALLSNMQTDAERVKSGFERGLSEADLTDEFSATLSGELEGQGRGLANRMRFASPAWMSVQGLARYWRKKDVRS